MATRIARSTAKQAPVEQPESYRRNRPLTTISTSPQVLFVLSQLGKNRSGRLSRYALRYHNQIKETLPEVKKEFKEKELQTLAERLHTLYGWHDRIAETVVTDDDFLKMLQIDANNPAVENAITRVNNWRRAGRSMRTMALIEDLEQRIEDLREEERSSRKPPTSTKKTDKVHHLRAVSN